MEKPTTQPKVLIQDARLEDASRISKLGIKVFSDCFGHTVTPEQLQSFIDSSYTVPILSADIQDPQKDFVLAVDSASGELLGFAQLTRGSTEPCLKDYESTVELQRIYLDPKAHGTGVAKMLHGELEVRAKKEQFKWLWLGVWEENFRAQKAYAKWGFKRVGEHVFDVGGDLQTDFVLIKEL